jgi:hypothetical protein
LTVQAFSLPDEFACEDIICYTGVARLWNAWHEAGEVMKKPVPEDFGMTPEGYRDAVTAITQHTQVEREHRRKVRGRWTGVLGLLAWPAGLAAAVLARRYFEDGFLAVLAFFAAFAGVIFVAVVLPELYPSPGSNCIARMREQIRPYEEAIEQYELQQERHWLNLRGTAFEKKLATLYRKLGYVVAETKGSYDGGVDLRLHKDGKRLIVQCKGHKKPIGVAAARDLYGTFMHSEVDGAVLACPAGFTDGVRTFVEGKPIELISAKELIAIAEIVDSTGGQQPCRGIQG